ncbi:HEAT repeat protein [Asanoa ferruginea]|uniref:HEAT repeat protein n=2 Tax=Asanoa ferruginea TaxID=53367 RepID=A0A3D9ZKH8_9ACTN|nr:HEAT repeat protein [Asanoa ferruginea]
MVGAVLHGGEDWQELQELYLGLLEHEDRQVRILAATCLGQLARVYGQLDEDRVVPELRRVKATDALSDIAVFLHPRRGR